MFTGIVREVGSVVAATGGAGGVRLEISAPRTAPLVEVGGSVSTTTRCVPSGEPASALTSTGRRSGKYWTSPACAARAT